MDNTPLDSKDLNVEQPQQLTEQPTDMLTPQPEPKKPLSVKKKIIFAIAALIVGVIVYGIGRGVGIIPQPGVGAACTYIRSQAFAVQQKIEATDQGYTLQSSLYTCDSSNATNRAFFSASISLKSDTDLRDQKTIEKELSNITAGYGQLINTAHVVRLNASSIRVEFSTHDIGLRAGSPKGLIVNKLAPTLLVNAVDPVMYTTEYRFSYLPRGYTESLYAKDNATEGITHKIHESAGRTAVGGVSYGDIDLYVFKTSADLSTSALDGVSCFAASPASDCESIGESSKGGQVYKRSAEIKDKQSRQNFTYSLRTGDMHYLIVDNACNEVYSDNCVPTNAPQFNNTEMLRLMNGITRSGTR